MASSEERVWRAAPGTLVSAVGFGVLVAGTIATLGSLIYRRDGDLWVSGALLALAVVVLLYTWRFAVHPRLRADHEQVQVRNPFSQQSFRWSDITVIAPGQNGLIVASEARSAEAWCVQKSNAALRRGRFTRADGIAHELIDLLELHEPPLVERETGLRIRRARPDESRLLARLERAASEEQLEHLFDPDRYPYPIGQITRRWHELLRDPSASVFILDQDEQEPLGFVAFAGVDVLRLGIVPAHTGQGYGSALLDFASGQIFDRGARAARLWVLDGNLGARAFYRRHGWVETGRRRPCGYPPAPEELQLTRANPITPRRSQ